MTCHNHGHAKCSCGALLGGCQHGTSSPLSIIVSPCVCALHRHDLLATLKQRAVQGHEEHPAFMIFAVTRVARELGMTKDGVMLEIMQYRQAMTGSTRLPGEAVRR